MATLIISLLIIAGFIFVVIEIFLVPGVSVPGLVGLAMIGYGIFKARSAYGISGALIATTVSVVAAVVLIKMALKSRAVKSIGLDYSEKEAKAIDDYSSLIGKEGTAVSTLRPSGTAMIDSKRFNVVTDGEYIEKDSPIQVSAIEGTRIIVATVENTGESSPVETDNT